MRGLRRGRGPLSLWTVTELAYEYSRRIDPAPLARSGANAKLASFAYSVPF